MELQVDEFNELWNAFRAGWQSAKAQAVQAEFEIGQLKDRITELLDERQDLYAQIEAQKVPEGFVLVKASDIAKLAIAVSRVDLMTYSEERPDSEKLAWQNVANKLEAMIKAQEQAND